jgi:putative cardiolipin synthase
MKRILRALLPAALLLASACTQLPERPDLPPASAIPAAQGSQLDARIAPVEARNPGASGFRLLSDGPEAFAVRAGSTKLAGRSLDVQTYIWHNDLTGLSLAAALLAAADRGVQVRLLLDDMDARAKNYGLAALDAHPNIEVRLFNPLASRSGAMSMGVEFLGGFGRLNHRMHNKSWIADNRIAVVGGRNLGDEYFGASDEVNFVDLDFAMVGPVVRDVSASFDRYWNSPAVYPIAVLSLDGVSEASLAHLRDKLAPAVEKSYVSRYAELLKQDDAVERLLGGDWPMTWTTGYRFVSDDPLKATREEGLDRSDVLVALREALAMTRQETSIISPYFVPGEAATASLTARAQSGTRVRILTNSLAANDVAAVHGGYSRYRKQLLEGGIELFELKPQQGAEVEQSFFGSSGASLHTKALTIDGETLFVGSFNLDPRSAELNTEQGVLATNPELARQLETIFERQVAGDRAWQVSLVDGKLHWSDGSAEYDSEPMASAGRRFQAWLARVFPIESQL